MSPLHLFDAVGIELEYMIVDRDTLKVRPFADRVLAAVNGGDVASEVELGRLSWSNELVAHVIELKTSRPVTTIDESLGREFAQAVRRIDELLLPHGARLLPTAMHPTMDPLRETVLWPHDYSPVYQAYDRIFGCQGHGWSNLQSMHLNYPFVGDEEFARLHAAVRLVLPLIPALAASSPVVEGRLTGLLDNRLEFYRTNSKAVPSIVGEVVPEAVFSREAYRRQIFEPMFEHIAPHDPEGILRDEFLNARGAIARFGRGSIEVRVIDIQECPRADLLVADAITAVLRFLVTGDSVDLETQQAWSATPLAAILRATLKDGAATQIADRRFLRQLRGNGETVSAGDLWLHLLACAANAGLLGESRYPEVRRFIEIGPLADRIRQALGPSPSADDVARVYRRLADCLQADELFVP